jgi:hypothetical protein
MTEYFFCPVVQRAMLDQHRHHDLKVCRVVGSEPWSRVLGSMQRRFAVCWNPILAISDDHLGDRSDEATQTGMSLSLAKSDCRTERRQRSVDSQPWTRKGTMVGQASENDSCRRQKPALSTNLGGIIIPSRRPLRN